MSRFGIRNKLKKALGVGGTGRSIDEFRVTYVLPSGDEHVVACEAGYTLLMASQTLPSTIGTGKRAGSSCPDSGCGSCRVEVIDATGLSPMDQRERDTIAAHVRGDPHEGHERQPGPPSTPNTRLACQTRVVGNGARVRVLEVVDWDSLRGV